MQSYEDDPSIGGSDRLLRRVARNRIAKNADGSLRPQSDVFNQVELSVNIESLMLEQKRPLEDTLRGYPGDYLTSVTAQQVREHDQIVVKDNEPPNDPAHGLVLGTKGKKFRNAMARSCQWIVPPDEEEG